MLIRTLLSISIASAALMASGCKTGGDNDVDLTSVNAGSPGSQPSTVTPIFSPANAKLPINTDFVFSAAATSDGTASVTDSSPPVTTAINDLAGFSTTATFYLPFNGALDADTVVAGQTVFLIELKSKEDNASIDALDLSSIIAASPTNPFAVGADQITAADYTARYVELDDGATPTIAITPLKPLDPKTKYLVALTNGIKSASGKAVSGSAEYELLSGDLGLPSAALAPARTAVQGWEKLAGGFLALATSGAITQDNIVLSYAFTTDGSLDSLKSYAAPSLFLADNLALASAEALIENANPGATTLIAQGVVQGGGGNPADAEQVAAAKLSAAYASAIYSTIASTALSQAGSLNAIADRPAARPVNIINGAVVDQTVNGALNVTTGASPATFIPGSTDSFSRYYQGQIQLPNFLATAAATMAADADWTANTTLGAVLDGAAGNAAGTTPPKDTDGSTNVTYRYPFPEKIADDAINYAPILVTMPAAVDYSAGGSNPAGSDCSSLTEVPVVIYVHGITGSRGNSLGYAAGLAANCVATVAIDLPLHGIAPQTTDSNGNLQTNALLAFNLDPALAASAPWAGVAASGVASGSTFANIAERHDNLYQNAAGARVAMNFATPAGTSGSAFINLQNFTRSRDNVRQAVVDLLNLNASLDNINTALSAQSAALTLDTDKVYVAGHSLGAIVATTFAAVNNDASVLAGNTNLNEIQGVILANGGATLTKLLENSPSFGPSIVGGLAASGVNQGTSNFESFMYVFQSTVDVIDPANSGATLAASSADILAFNMVGGNALPSDASGISYPDGFKTAGVFLPDPTVPNFDYFADAGTNPFAAFAPALGLPAGIDSAYAPLAGTKGLTSVLDLSVVNISNPPSDQGSPVRAEARFATGTHSTFANADARDAFTEMLTQTLFLINGAYTALPANATVLEQ